VEVAIERASGKIKVERVACAHVGDSPGSKTKIPTEAGGFTGGAATLADKDARAVRMMPDGLFSGTDFQL
jgi:hypothetical protein